MSDLPEEFRLATPVSYTERAEFYKVEYDAIDDRNFLQSLITPQVEKILEVPCGVGRNAVWLAQSDAKFIVGVDAEPLMITKLKERLSRERLLKRIRLVSANIKNMDLQSRFDLIIVPKESFQLIDNREDALQTLSNLKRHLDRPGSIMIDLALFCNQDSKNPEACPSYYDPLLKDGKIVFDWRKKTTDGTMLSRYREQTNVRDFMVIDFYYLLEGAGGKNKYTTHKIKLKKYSYDNFVKLAREADLHLKNVYKDYERNYFEPSLDRAGRMILLLGH